MNGYFERMDDETEFRLDTRLMYRCNDNARPAVEIPNIVTYLVTCDVNETSGELYWDGADDLPVCIENVG